MKNFLLVALFSAVMVVSGCAFMDSLILERVKNEDGVEMFTDSDNHLTEDAINPETGEPNQPAYRSATSPEFEAVKNVAANASGPFAPLVIGLLGLFGTGYAAVRGRRKVNGEKIVSDILKRLSTLALKVYSDFKEGIIDVDGDGTISLEEMRRYALESGVSMDAAVDMLKIAQSGMPPTEMQKALDELVKKHA